MDDSWWGDQMETLWSSEEDGLPSSGSSVSGWVSECECVSVCEMWMCVWVCVCVCEMWMCVWVCVCEYVWVWLCVWVYEMTECVWVSDCVCVGLTHHSHTHSHAHTHIHPVCRTQHICRNISIFTHTLTHTLHTFTHQLTLTHSSTHLLPEDGKPLPLHRLHLSPHQARPVSAVSN